MPDIVFTISIMYTLNQSFQVNEYRSVMLSNSGTFYYPSIGGFTSLSMINLQLIMIDESLVLHPAREQDTSTSFLFYMNESVMPRQKFTRVEVLYAANLCSIDLVHRKMLMGHIPNNG